MPDRVQALARGLVEELAGVIGALLDRPVTAAPVEASDAAAQWILRFRVAGELRGSVVLGFDASMAGLSAAIVGLEAEPAEAAVLDTVKELGGQAAAALGHRAAGANLQVSVQSVASAANGVPSGAATFFTLSREESPALAIACWTDLVTDETARLAPAASVSPAPAPRAETPANLDVILDIDLPLSVRFGETEMTLASLVRLGPGSVIDLGRSPDDPVDVLVNGKMVARGEVVVVAGSYGVRITEVISAADRIRSMGV